MPFDPKGPPAALAGHAARSRQRTAAFCIARPTSSSKPSSSGWTEQRCLPGSTACRARSILASNTFDPDHGDCPDLKLPERVAACTSSTVHYAPGTRLAGPLAGRCAVHRQPGVPGHHVGRAFVPEAQRLLSEGIASVADIDRILTGAAGFRIGPFALADLVGIDVQHAVMELIYGLFYNEPAFSPFPLGAARRRGFLWPEDRGWLVSLRERQENRARRCRAPTARPKWVWLRRSTQHAELQVPLLELPSAGGATLETGEAPTAEALIVRYTDRLRSHQRRRRSQARGRTHGGNRRPVRHEGATHPNGDAGY